MTSSRRFRKMLIHTCTIQLRTVGAVDARGNETVTWANNSTGVDCLFMPRSHQMLPGQEIEDRAKDVLLTDWIVFMEVRTLTEADYRITNITRKSDSGVVEAGPLNIRLIKNAAGQNHHLEVHVSKGSAANVT